MSAARLWQGRVRVQATGPRVEHLINATISSGATLYNVRRESARSATFETSYPDFFTMRRAFRNAGCRIRILSRRGIPRLRSRLRARFAFATGAVACLIALMGVMQFVWDVRIIGDIDIEQRTIAQEVLENLAVRPGMLRGEIDAKLISAQLNEHIGGLMFAGARMRGLILEVEIAPAPLAPEMIDINTPVDIVADVAGTVERVMVLEGTAAVVPGQQVKPGDVLIEGVAVGPGGVIQVHALGEVTLRRWARGEGEAPLKRRVSRPTGRYENQSTLTLLGYELPVRAQAPFAEYAVASRETRILPGLFLPASLITETLHEMQVSYLDRDEGEVQREAEQSAILSALAKVSKDTTIVDKRVEFSKMKDTTLYAEVGLQYLDKVGVERRR